MSENFQLLSATGVCSPLQLSPSAVSRVAPLTGSVCDSSRVLVPALSSAWLQPSASVTYFQPVMASSYIYQHRSASRFAAPTGQSHIATSTVSYPVMWQWDHRASSANSYLPPEAFAVTLTEQSMAVASSSTAAHASTVIPVYPVSLVPATPPPHIMNQGHSYFYNQGVTGPLLSAELGGLQPYECVSHTGGVASGPQPEIVMVLKEIQHTTAVTTVSNSPAIYYSGTAQANTETSFQVNGTSPEMVTSLGWQALGQAGFVPQPPECPESCSSKSTQLLEGSPLAELGDVIERAPEQSPTPLSTLDPSWQQAENWQQEESWQQAESWEEMINEQSKSLDTHQILRGDKDPPLLSLEAPEPSELLATIEPACPEEPASDVPWGKCHLNLQERRTLDQKIESSPGWADVTALVKDMQLPQALPSLDNLDQSNNPIAIETQDTCIISVNQVQENSGIIKAPSPQVRKNKHKASEPITGAPAAKIQLKVPESLAGGEEAIFSAAVSDRPLVDTAEKSHSKCPSSTNQNKGRRQEKAKRARENNGKKGGERKRSRPKVKAEEKPTIPRMKRKRQQPALEQEAFKMPRTCLGRHMLESVQVFHPLGKKLDKKPSLFSSQTLRTSSATKDPETFPTSKPWPEAPRKGKGPERAWNSSQSPHSTAQTEAPPASPQELPPPGKVKLIPLPFLSPDKPQAKPIARRPQPLASRRPTAAYPVGPTATNTAQPSQTAAGNTSLMAPVKPAQPIQDKVSHPCLTSSTQPGVPQSAVSKPAPQATLPCSSLRREPIPTAVTKPRPPPQPRHPYLLEDFSRQPIPWREPNVPEPVMSTPITEEQRPEREAMKRRAQQERERAAKYTSLGKLQFFRQRERDMEISLYYGYAR